MAGARRPSDAGAGRAARDCRPPGSAHQRVTYISWLKLVCIGGDCPVTAVLSGQHISVQGGCASVHNGQGASPSGAHSQDAPAGTTGAHPDSVQSGSNIRRVCVCVEGGGGLGPISGRLKLVCVWGGMPDAPACTMGKAAAIFDRRCAWQSSLESLSRPRISSRRRRLRWPAPCRGWGGAGRVVRRPAAARRRCLQYRRFLVILL